MRSIGIAALLLATSFIANTHAAEWEATLLGLKMNLPDSPGWGPFKSSDKTERVGRQKIGQSMFALSARAFTPKENAGLTGDKADRLLQAVTDILTIQSDATSEPQKTVVDGIPGYRVIPRPKQMSSGKIHGEVLFWIHRGHLFTLTLGSNNVPVAENPELTAVIQSIHLEKP